jgi:subtilisin family serine protease
VTSTTPTPGSEITPPIGFLFAADGAQWIDSAEYGQSTETDTVGRTIVGHNGAESVISVAATGVGQDDRIDYYSSLGPVSYYLTPDTADGSGSLLAEPRTFAKPSILSVDAVRNTVLSTPVPGEPGVFLFRGTSAASPNAAAVAALALQLDPSLTPAELRTLLERSAAPIVPPYATVSAADSIGAGLVDAQALLALIAADLPVPPAPALPQPARLAESGPADQTGMVLLAAALVGLGVAVVVRRRRLARG